MMRWIKFAAAAAFALTLAGCINTTKNVAEGLSTVMVLKEGVYEVDGAEPGKGTLVTARAGAVYTLEGFEAGNSRVETTYLAIYRLADDVLVASTGDGTDIYRYIYVEMDKEGDGFTLFDPKADGLAGMSAEARAVLMAPDAKDGHIWMSDEASVAQTREFMIAFRRNGKLGEAQHYKLLP